MRRVIGAVDWSSYSQSSHTFHALYETFLDAYAPELRRKSGSYFTPREVTTAIVRLVDEALKRNLKTRQGLANSKVVVIDPAMGTGSFLLSLIEK
jgi:type I restriction-modification system DNA methylase subunit